MLDGYSICNTSTTVQIQPTLKYTITIEICIFINSICSLDMVCHLQHCPFFVTSSHIFREQMISLQNEEGNIYVHVHVSKCTLKCLTSKACTHWTWNFKVHYFLHIDEKLQGWSFRQLHDAHRWINLHNKEIPLKITVQVNFRTDPHNKRGYRGYAMILRVKSRIILEVPDC